MIASRSPTEIAKPFPSKVAVIKSRYQNSEEVQQKLK
jgi:hypothetical protein